MDPVTKVVIASRRFAGTMTGYRELRAVRAEQLLAKLRPVGPVDAVRLQLAGQHLDDIRALDATMKPVPEQITALVTEFGTQLTTLYGLGPVIAARLLAEVEDIARFASKAKLRLL